MNTIYKAIIRSARQAVHMPVGAKVLTAQIQHSQICIWYLLDDTKPCINRFFSVYGTGISIDEKRFDYIATVQEDNGDLIWHVFEVFP